MWRVCLAERRQFISGQSAMLQNKLFFFYLFLWSDARNDSQHERTTDRSDNSLFVWFCPALESARLNFLRKKLQKLYK